jgi:hypothetical protein
MSSPDWKGNDVVTHYTHSIRVLARTKSTLPEVNDALQMVALGRGHNERIDAVVGLIRRNATDVPYDVLIKTAGEDFYTTHALSALRELASEGSLGRIPEEKRDLLIEAFKAQPGPVDDYASGWIEMNVPAGREIAQYLWLNGPKVRAALRKPAPERAAG